MLNISGGQFLVLVFLALVLIGPEKLPQYAGQLARLVKTLKRMMTGATTTLKEELGEEYSELAKFDPRQYDPRRIVRDALLEDVVPATKPARPRAAAPPPAAAHQGSEHAPGAPGAAAPPEEAVPFDDEAT